MYKRSGFNTASGMRSHVTRRVLLSQRLIFPFQYRKRYEVTCDMFLKGGNLCAYKFQYRKRYEVTCDAYGAGKGKEVGRRVSIPQAV